VGAVDMHRPDLEEKGSHMEVLCHFGFQDGYRQEVADKQTWVEHNPLVLEGEMVDLGAGTQVQDKSVPELEWLTLVALTLFVRQKMWAL